MGWTQRNVAAHVQRKATFLAATLAAKGNYTLAYFIAGGCLIAAALILALLKPPAPLPQQQPAPASA